MPKPSIRLTDFVARTNTLLDSITGAVPSQSTLAAANVKSVSSSSSSAPATQRKRQSTICSACGSRFNTLLELDRHYNLVPEHSPYADAKLDRGSRSARSRTRTAELSTSSDDPQKLNHYMLRAGQSPSVAFSGLTQGRSKSSSDILDIGSKQSSERVAPPPSPSTGFSDFSRDQQGQSALTTAPLMLRGRTRSATTILDSGMGSPSSLMSSLRLARPSLSSMKSSASTVSPGRTRIETVPSYDEAVPSTLRTPVGRPSTRNWTPFNDAVEAPDAPSNSLGLRPSQPSSPEPRMPVRLARTREDAGGPNSPPASGSEPPPPRPRCDTDESAEKGFRRNRGKADELPSYTAAVSSDLRSYPCSSRSAANDLWDIFVRTHDQRSTAPSETSSRSNHKAVEPRRSTEFPDEDPFGDVQDGQRHLLPSPSLTGGRAGHDGTQSPASPRTRPMPSYARTRTGTNPFDRPDSFALAIQPPPPPRRAASARVDRSPTTPIGSQGRPIGADREDLYFHPYFGGDVHYSSTDTSQEIAAASSASSSIDRDMFAEGMPDLVASYDGGPNANRTSTSPNSPLTPRQLREPTVLVTSSDEEDDDKMPGAWQGRFVHHDEGKAVMHDRVVGLGVFAQPR